MQALLFTLMVVFISGCLIRNNNESRAKVDFDIQEQEAPPTSFDDCFADMKKGYHNSSLRIKEFKFFSCEILVGHANEHGFSKNIPYIRGVSLRNYNNYKQGRNTFYYGYEDVQKFMDLKRITCERITENGNEVLRFKFPVNDVGHADYQHANLKCGNSSDTQTWLNLTYSRRYNILNFDMQFGKDKKTATYHVLTTDNNGVIKQHVKTFGQHGQETVILNNYQLQQ